MNLEELATQETEAFELFKQKYMLMHPMRAKPGAASLGLEFTLLLITSLAALIVAALRTSEQFYRAASIGGNSVLAMAEAISVMFAVEGGLVVYSAIRAKGKQEFSKSSIAWGIALMLGISTMAGLGQSIHLITNVDAEYLRYFEYTLSFVIGVFSSVLAWIGGDMLGGQIANISVENRRIENDYNLYLDDYNTSMLSSWSGSAERKISRGDLNQIAGSFGSFTPNRTESKPPVRQPIKENEIFEYLARVFNSDGRVAGPKEIADALNCSKGYASDVQKKWVEQNSNIL